MKHYDDIINETIDLFSREEKRGFESLRVQLKVKKHDDVFCNAVYVFDEKQQQYRLFIEDCRWLEDEPRLSAALAEVEFSKRESDFILKYKDVLKKHYNQTHEHKFEDAEPIVDDFISSSDKYSLSYKEKVPKVPKVRTARIHKSDCNCVCCQNKRKKELRT